MASELSPETIIDMHQDEGYVCVGIIFAHPKNHNTIVAWKGDFPEILREEIMKSELDGSYTSKK